MTLNDRQELGDKINELSSLIADSSSTSEAIQQKTSELKQLTDMLVSTYTPVLTPSP